MFVVEARVLMVLSAKVRDPARLVDEVPQWIANARKEAHRALGDVEVGVRRAVEEAAAAIASRAVGDELPSIDDIQQDSLRFLGNVGPILDVLADRMVKVLATQIRPLDRMASELTGVPEASIRAARAGWDRAIRAYAAAVGQYVAGYVEGGGIAFALWTELPPEYAGHTGEVASVLAERLAFVTKRAEAVVSSWLTEVQREIEDLLISMAPTAAGPMSSADAAPSARRPLQPDDVPQPAPLMPADLRTPPLVPRASETVPTLPMPTNASASTTPPTARRRMSDPGRQSAPTYAPPAPDATPMLGASVADRLASMLARAELLGVRVKNPPATPSETYLERLDAQLRGVESRLAAGTADREARASRLADLVAFAEQLRLKVRDAPVNPSEAYLDKMEARLLEVAERKGIAAPPSLGGPTPLPAGGAAGGIAAALDAAVTLEQPPSPDGQRKARVEALIEKAMAAGLDLGRIPADPTTSWIVLTEAKLHGAINRRHDDRRGQRKNREAERRARIERLHQQADQLGVDLEIPAFPTDEWLARAELRVAAMVLTPAGGGSVSDSGRAERFNEVYAQAVALKVGLGTIPPDPDDVWLTWAESRVAEAVASGIAIPAESATGDLRFATLIFEEGTIQEQRWSIGEQPLLIGRARENAVQIRDDAAVSRKHCGIRRVEGRYVLRDEGSTKGTYVDGRRIVRDYVLRGGERITLGETHFVFRVGQ